MKILLIFLLLGRISEGSIYEITVEELSGTSTSLSAFANKRIAVVTLNEERTNPANIHYFDSLQNVLDTVQIILVPSGEVLDSSDIAGLITLQQGLTSSLIITRPASVTKSSGSAQHELLKWLTDVARNTHFDHDGDPGSSFIVSSSGKMYAALSPEAPNNVFETLIKKELSE